MNQYEAESESQLIVSVTMLRFFSVQVRPSAEDEPQSRRRPPVPSRVGYAHRLGHSPTVDMSPRPTIIRMATAPITNSITSMTVSTRSGRIDDRLPAQGGIRRPGEYRGRRGHEDSQRRGGQQSQYLRYRSRIRPVRGGPVTVIAGKYVTSRVRKSSLRRATRISPVRCLFYAEPLTHTGIRAT